MNKTTKNARLSIKSKNTKGLLMTFKTVLFIIFFLVTAAVAYPQNTTSAIFGTVVEGDGKSIAGVSVSLFKASDSSLVLSTLSDEKGAFFLTAPGNGKYYISATHTGYQTGISSNIVITGKPIKLLPISMSNRSSVLKEVKVTARSNPIEAKNGKLIYNVEKSITATGISAFELLQRTPGVTVNQDDNLLLKGSANANVMIDGKMTYLSAQQLSNMLKSMPAENISRIEVINTPSAQYDAAGATGIINIITKKSNKQGYAANISAGVGIGHYLLNTHTFTGNIKTKKFNIFGNLGYDFRHSYTNKLSRQIVGDNSTTTVYDKNMADRIKTHYYSFKAGADIYISKKQQAGFSYTGYIDDWSRELAGPNYLQDKSGQTNAIVQNQTLAKEPYYNNIYNFNYQFTLDTAGKIITADADYISYRNNSDGYISNQMFDKDRAALQPYQKLLYHQPSNVDIKSVKTDVEYPLAAYKLKAGLKYSSVAINNDFRYDSLINNNYIYSTSLSDYFIYKEKIAAAYLSAAKQWKSTGIEIGLRAEHTLSDANSVSTGTHTKRNYTNLFPSLALDQKLNDNNKLTLSISRRINRPSYSSLNPVRYFSDKYSYYQGNPYLKPEQSWVASLSYTLMDKYIATVSYNRTNNFISQSARIDSSGVLVSTNANFFYAGRADIMLIAPVKIRSFWNINMITDVAYNYYPLAELANARTVRKLSVDVSVNQTFTIPAIGALELRTSYTSPALNGVYVIKHYLSVDGGIKKTLIKNKLDVKFAFADLFHTVRYQGYSIDKAVNYSYNSIPDSRRVRLTLTYNIGGKLSGGKSHSIEEENRL